MPAKTNINSNIVQSGKGVPVILIHGLGGNLTSWDVVAGQLEKRFRVIRYDLRGHGHSDNPPGPWSLDDFVGDLKNITKQLFLEKCHLVGFSLGGLISQGFTLKYPDMLGKLVIVSAVAGRTDQERHKVIERVKNLENGDLDTNIELAMERWFSPAFRNDHPERVKKRLDDLMANDPQGYLNAYRVFGHGDLAEKLNRITCPTLIMTGEDDPGSSVRMSELMHREINNSRLEILPGLRHSVLVESPETIAAKIDDFL